MPGLIDYNMFLTELERLLWLAHPNSRCVCGSPISDHGCSINDFFQLHGLPQVRSVDRSVDSDGWFIRALSRLLDEADLNCQCVCGGTLAVHHPHPRCAVASFQVQRAIEATDRLADLMWNRQWPPPDAPVVSDADARRYVLPGEET